MRNKETWAYSFKSSLPVLAGYVVLGMGFGILLQGKGYSWWWALIMSVTIFAGSMQYVAIDLLSGGATLIASFIMTIAVNFRHIFYGLTMLEKYKNVGWRKLYLIFALSDETFSLVCDPEIPEGVEIKDYYLLVSMMNQCYWVIGSVIGALLGHALNFNSAGVEFSMTALFVVIFTEQWEKTQNHIPAITGLVITAVSLIIFGSSNFLIPAMFAITVAMFAEKKYLKEGTV